MHGVRFAPSPTGRFHLGNLRTALLSQELANQLGQPWAIRFEDIDTLRVIPGAREQQLQDLADVGLIPDRITLQSENHARHEALFRKALREGQLYPCTCSRREVQLALAQAASAPHSPVPAYSGHCRPSEIQPWDPQKLPPFPAFQGETLGWRFRMDSPDGRDDFIAARTGRDGRNFSPAYPWACAIDDADEGHLWLVRASDLASALPAQRAIQKWMGLRKFPSVLHAALVTQNDGARLEKRTHGVTLPEISKQRSASDAAREIRNSFKFPSHTDWTLPNQMLFEKIQTVTLAEIGFKDG
jgi:glutamyl-tRNA synthetase